MSTKPAKVQVFASWFVSFLTPVVVLLLAVRIVLNPWYVEFEYRTPGFPADPFGFTREERIEYAKIGLDYLINTAGIAFLAEQRFPAGQMVPPESCIYMDDCNLMYNERELQHMLDVKTTVQGALKVLYAGVLLLVALAIWSWRGGWEPEFRRGLRRGGWLTLILIGIVFACVALLFGWFFVFFHNMFFTEGTWRFLYSDTLIRLFPERFLYSDTLIRLFPERFWRDTFIVVGVITAIMALGVTRLRSAVSPVTASPGAP